MQMALHQSSSQSLMMPVYFFVRSISRKSADAWQGHQRAQRAVGAVAVGAVEVGVVVAGGAVVGAVIGAVTVAVSTVAVS